MIQDLEKIIKINKDKIFYKVDDKYLTYNDLWIKAKELSKSLNNQGNEPVLIYGDKSVEMIISIVACLISKRTYIPIGLCTPLQRVELISKLTNSKLLINNTNNNLNLSIETLNIKELNTKYFSLESKNNNNNNNTNNNIAYMIFTSGSTGNPKGVPISYENLENFIKWISNFEVLKDYKNINVLNQASFSFDLSVADLYYSLFNGHTLIGLNKNTQDDLSSVLKAIKTNQINLMVITPTFIKFLLLNSNFNQENYPNLKCIYFCGEILEKTTVIKIKERFKNVKIINAYGPTEATSAVSAVLITDKMLSNEYLPIGKKETSAVNIEIINDEIVLKGKSVFSGYLNIESNKCYKENNINCFKTNDLGYYNNEYLYCKGRIDNQIKYSGYRIELGDIENNLLKIDSVNEAVVIAKKNDKNIVKFLKAYITINKKIEISDIKIELSKLIPEYMIPKTITILDKIPTNNNGKYDRKKLEELQ